MFHVNLNFLERVNLFQGLKNMLATEEVQIIKPHLINAVLILSPIFVIQYLMLKRNEYSFNKHTNNNENSDSTHEKYIERKMIINGIFRFVYTLITIIYLLNLSLLNK